jgi:biotin transport system substrate-specific component
MVSAVGIPLDSVRGKPVESPVMTSRPLVSHASTILDQISMRAASANAWTGVQLLSVVFVAVLTAAAAQVSFPLPFTPVPFTIQPMIVLIGAAALGARLGALSQILYLTLGIAGLPVFAYAPDLPQGFARLLGPSGGYLMAYPIAAFATGRLAEFGFDRRYASSIVAMAVGLSVIFIGGVAWIARVSGLDAALATGLYPFIVVDVIKIVAAGLVLPTAWKFLRH